MIHLVLVTFNRLYYTKLALASILSDKKEMYTLTIWDNHSDDGTAEYLKNEINDSRIDDIVFSKKNVGQTAAVNSVWSNSKADLIGKLDNDCIVTPGWTRTLAQAHEDIPELGAVACWHFYPDDFDYERAKHKIFDFGRHKIFRHPWICGTGFLLKRRTYTKYGPIMDKATTSYWIKIAIGGCINGFYYPLIYQEHMDDPKSKYSTLKDEVSYQAAKAVTFGINRHRQMTLEDRWKWRQKVIASLHEEPWEVKNYVGWRKKLRTAKVLFSRYLKR